MSTRRSAREWALRVLFESDVGGAPMEEVLTGALERARLDDAGRSLMADLCRAVIARKREYDRVITAHAVGHALDRLAKTDRVVLRMALAEMNAIGTPVAVVINEAVDLAKKYGTEDSGRFVNGILGKIVKDFEEKSKGTGDKSDGSDS